MVIKIIILGLNKNSLLKTMRIFLRKAGLIVLVLKQIHSIKDLQQDLDQRKTTKQVNT